MPPGVQNGTAWQKEGMNDLEFVDNILEVTTETVPQDEVESLYSDDEFNVEVWSVSKAQI